ncbi:aspartic proteinase nepenthesin-1-like [Bidens hawaiensis]|uniref:aspartic proteinase nepenthesin-1-like n=1 Tax=Bidens hawaiensis TaxID=980011 RepID=UPI004049BED9
MASSIFLASHILSLILFYLLLATKPTSSVQIPTETKQISGFRASLTLRNSGKTWPKYASTNQLKDNPSASLQKSKLKYCKDVYTVSLAIGTPPVTFSAIMDTGSNLIWTKCKTSTSSGVFDTSESRSFSNVSKSCAEVGLDPDCIQKYDDGNVSVRVTLGQETLTIGSKKMSNAIFGCGKLEKPFSFDGIVGMGPGQLSLVSHLEKRVFSYCLGSRSDPKAGSVLLTGSEANTQNGNIQTTPLVMDESNYYVSLEGISVGKTKLSVTKSDFLTSNRSPGGMIIDSGTTFTYLKHSIIDMISNELVMQTKLEKIDIEMYYNGLEYCFHSPGVVFFPKLVFHFEGADWELPKENYLYEEKNKGMACLAFIANEVPLFGNMQQQNMMVIYDLDKKSLSFYRPPTCNIL